VRIWIGDAAALRMTWVGSFGAVHRQILHDSATESARLVLSEFSGMRETYDSITFAA